MSERGASVSVGVNRPFVYKAYSERLPFECIYVRTRVHVSSELYNVHTYSVAFSLP